MRCPSACDKYQQLIWQFQPSGCCDVDTHATELAEFMKKAADNTNTLNLHLNHSKHRDEDGVFWQIIFQVQLPDSKGRKVAPVCFATQIMMYLVLGSIWIDQVIVNTATLACFTFPALMESSPRPSLVCFVSMEETI